MKQSARTKAINQLERIVNDGESGTESSSEDELDVEKERMSTVGEDVEDPRLKRKRSSIFEDFYLTPQSVNLTDGVNATM